VPSLADIKSATLRLATNLRGWRTRRKLLVIESDDWGAIRMPNRRVWERLLAAGIRVDKSIYDSLDCLENYKDLEALMNVIDSHSDSGGRPATFTFNTVMGNPDFTAIHCDGFARFHHQHLFESYRHYHGEDLEPIWRKAIATNLIRPQLHAREHLNTPLWLRDLRAGHRETRLAFEENFYGLKTRTGSPLQKNYLAAYWPESWEQLREITEIARNGVKKFEDTFGYRPKSFIGCNYVWPEALEEELAQLGVKLLQTQRGRIQPDPQCNGATSIRRHYTGQMNQHGQHYSVRNVLFEPYLDKAADWADRALAEITQAFRLGRPAIICSHRINFVSGMDLANRDRSLRQLDRLLTAVRRRWPEVEFTTSDELSDKMTSGAAPLFVSLSSWP
jgi:hypothetical protein